MKRIALLTFAMLMGIFCYAQSGHLEFSGIPINGTITQFQARLMQKGYALNRQASNSMPNGTRIFEGVFIGHNVILFVYYDKQTKNVYRVKAIIRNLSESMADQKYEEVQVMLLQKYNNSYSAEGVKDGKPGFCICPKRYRTYSGQNYNWKECYGEISLYISKDKRNINYPYLFNVHIDYNDQINSDKHNNNLLDEL